MNKNKSGPFGSGVSTGKHMICDLTNIRNVRRLESIESMRELFDDICERNGFTILDSIEHVFSPQGLSLIYMLSESHISIHTFPERRYLAFDLYTCRHYDDDSVYMGIHNQLVSWFQCDWTTPTIIPRGERPATTMPTVNRAASEEFGELCNGV